MNLNVGTFWIGVASALITLLGVGVAILIDLKSKQRKLITYELEDHNTNLVSIDRDKGENITILVDGKPVEQVRYQLIKIRNEGNVAIEDKDYDPQKPLRIFFTPQTGSRTSQSSEIILRAGIPEAAPDLEISGQNAKDYIILETSDVQNQYVAMKKLMLNAGDWIKIKVLTLVKVNIEVRGQIKNGQIKAFVPTQSRLTWRKGIRYALVGALLLFLLYNSLGLITSFIQGNCVWGSIEARGSSAFYSTANDYAKDYHAACPVGIVTVNQEPDASVSLADLRDGKIQIAPSEMPNSYARSIFPDVKDHPVAVIVFTVVVSKNVTGITSLTEDQLRKIYNGTYQNWHDVKSDAPNLPIQVYGRPTDSGTYNAFTSYVLQLSGKPKAPSYQPVDRTKMMAEAVANHSGAIGYVDVGTAGQMSSVITSVEINGYAPTPTLVENNTYRFWAIEHMYTREDPDMLATSFITYVSNHMETNDEFIKLQDMPENIWQMHV